MVQFGTAISRPGISVARGRITSLFCKRTITMLTIEQLFPQAKGADLATLCPQNRAAARVTRLKMHFTLEVSAVRAPF